MSAERIVLVGGLWLDSSVWTEVVVQLAERGRDAVPVHLPADRDTTLADQLAAVLAAIDDAPGRVVVAGHSAACALAWLAADARPDRVARVALIGGWPRPDGAGYADWFPIADGVMPFPGWTPFEGADAADLDEPRRQAFVAASVPVPEAVARGAVRYTSDRRFDVPVTLICPEYTPAQAREWLDAGDLPELPKVKHLDMLDLDSGHWPMLTRPAELATLLATL
ncbi:pimeloyl-ACP methyl ester carboxylesterase [Actinoplanes octamycinicus]|uniref:Pimeloyl-ACP methyl ester carboxylesterase n=1 Tax=Actinoplanes octamycinicus TaxID=135948 RepID=A0A7W7H451_9ACTN|nr:alpha/beta hydrolase [Actinoplanes octamycinicus]MBB4743621.1 pimeloyl-ACP methyl ester carboxylesterase [Actinoplanes octamycinicus]GIE61046.1 esterase [Actinoplanes octamycinicus]